MTLDEAALESRTDYEYDKRNFLSKVTNFESGKAESYLSYVYDYVGNVLEMRTANGTQITKYKYDNFGRLSEMADQPGQKETYSYDNEAIQCFYHSGRRKWMLCA